MESHLFCRRLPKRKVVFQASISGILRLKGWFSIGHVSFPGCKKEHSRNLTAGYPKKWWALEKEVVPLKHGNVWYPIRSISGVKIPRQIFPAFLTPLPSRLATPLQDRRWTLSVGESNRSGEGDGGEAQKPAGGFYQPRVQNMT